MGDVYRYLEHAGIAVEEVNPEFLDAPIERIYRAGGPDMEFFCRDLVLTPWRIFEDPSTGSLIIHQFFEE